MRAVLVAAIASAVVFGSVIAATGISQLQVFEPGTGLLSQRLTKIEDYLEPNSREVKTEFERLQGEIDALAVCPDAREAVYLSFVRTSIDGVRDVGLWMAGFERLADREVVALFWIQASILDASMQALIDRDPPPDSSAAERLHTAGTEMATTVIESFDVMGEALDPFDEAALGEGVQMFADAAPKIRAVVEAIGEFCASSSLTPTPVATRDAIRSQVTTTPTPTARPTPTPTPTPTIAASHPLVEEFGCQWIMDTYRPMTMVGRDLAVQHLANSMMLKRQETGQSMRFIGSGDAAVALRECEALGYT